MSQLSRQYRCGDVEDVEAYVRATIRKRLPGVTEGEFEDFVAEGFRVVEEVRQGLDAGASLRQALGVRLGNALVDCWREMHPSTGATRAPARRPQSWQRAWRLTPTRRST